METVRQGGWVTCPELPTLGATGFKPVWLLDSRPCLDVWALGRGVCVKGLLVLQPLPHSQPLLGALLHSYTAEPTVSLGASRSRASPGQRSCYFHALAGAVQAFLRELPRAGYQSPGVFPGNPEFSVEALRFCYYGEHFSSQSERNSNFYSSKQEISSCICQIH